MMSLNTDLTEDKSIEPAYKLSSQKFYHGTKANLEGGELIEPGFDSNYGKRKKTSYVYLTATLDAAIWGAELAMGEGSGRIYIVVPTGPIEDDPQFDGQEVPWKSNDVLSFQTSASGLLGGHRLAGSLPSTAQGHERAP